jgi:hypothetical protein
MRNVLYHFHSNKGIHFFSSAVSVFFSYCFRPQSACLTNNHLILFTILHFFFKASAKYFAELQSAAGFKDLSAVFLHIFTMAVTLSVQAYHFNLLYSDSRKTRIFFSG